MIPLVKDSKVDVTSSDNYRAIGLSTVLVKVFEYVLLFRSYQYLSTSNQQFGYKQQHSTIQCTWVANETISYYNSMKSDVYCCLLDCTKAFDRVSFKTLFVKLLKTAISAVLLRCLFFIYSNLQAFTLWNNVSSDKFVILNGVRQGSVLSPILFGYYMEI